MYSSYVSSNNTKFIDKNILILFGILENYVDEYILIIIVAL